MNDDSRFIWRKIEKETFLNSDDLIVDYIYQRSVQCSTMIVNFRSILCFSFPK